MTAKTHSRRKRRKPAAEPLEQRRVLAGLVHSLIPDSIGPQEGAAFGDAVAVSEQWRVVGAPATMTVHDQGRVGAVYVYDQDNQLLHTFQDPTPDNGDRFGDSLAIDENMLVVGEPSHDRPFANQAGQVHLYDLNSLSLITTLQSSQPGFKNQFGSTVAIGGGRVAIQERNSVHLYDMASGQLERTLASPVADSGDQFGAAIAIDSGNVLIGAPGHAVDGQRAGTAYLFDAANGSLKQTFDNPNPSFKDSFGSAVAMEGTRVVIGDPNAPDLATNAGQAYVFDATSGNLVRTLSDPAPVAQDLFGTSVDIQGEHIVVAAVEDKSGSQAVGKVFVFDAGTGALLGSLMNPTGEYGNASYFGSSLDLHEGVAIVGANGDDFGETNAGRAHIFDLPNRSLTETLFNATPPIEDRFAEAVAIEETTIAVGAPRDDSSVANSGTVGVFDAVSGQRSYLLQPPTPQQDARFGSSVAVHNDLIAAGEPEFHASGNMAAAGRAHVFDATSGQHVATLNNPEPGLGDHFGQAIDIFNNRVVVGAPDDDGQQLRSGLAYVFDATTGAVERTLEHPDASNDDRFGASVAIDDDYIAVGVPEDDEGGSNAGAVVVYRASDGQLIRVITDPSPDAGDQFGRAIDLHDGLLAVGVENDESLGTAIGAAYLFDVSSGQLVRSVAAPETGADSFGTSVSIDGNTLVVGSEWHQGAIDRIGRAYAFDIDTGNLLRALDDPTPNPFDVFGGSVAVAGHRVLVGAAVDDSQLTNQGAAYLYHLNEAPTGVISSNDSFAENIVDGQVFTTFATQDPDVGDQHHYSLVSGPGDDDNARFTIDGAQLRVVGSFDFEQQNEFSVRVRTTDSFGFSFERTLAFALTDINEPPTELSLGAWTIGENQAPEAVIGAFSTSDPDFGGLFGYSLVDGDGSEDNQFFLIENEQLKATQSFDFEQQSSFNIRVRTTDPGGLSLEKAFTIEVNDVNEPPQDLTISNRHFLSSIDLGTNIALLSASDPDTSDSLTFELVTGDGDSDNSRFLIDGNQLRTSTLFDAAPLKPVYSIRVQVSDHSGAAIASTYQLEMTADFRQEDEPLGLNRDGGQTVIDVGGTNWLETHQSEVTLLVSDDTQFATDVPFELHSVERPQFRFLQVFRNGEFRLRVEGSTWTNFVEPTDVNGSGTVEPLDALLVINAVAVSEYTFPESPRLVDARSVAEFPNRFFDVNGDNQLTPLDALNVINELARRQNQRSLPSQSARVQLSPESLNASPFDDSEFIDELGRLF
jgi:hypothetical protein